MVIVLTARGDKNSALQALEIWLLQETDSK